LTPLTAHSGPFFSTTNQGGAHNLGTVYSVTTAGEESVLHDFKGGADGVTPAAGLTHLNGVFYGTTRYGGSGCRGSFYHGCGTIYRLNASDKEEVVYRFKGGTDGADPNGMIAANGTLYGTTFAGGSSRTCGLASTAGCGTVFKLTASGKEEILYRFKGGKDSAGPFGSLFFTSGEFYGVASGGGQYCVVYPTPSLPCGSIFVVNPSGKEHVLHVFGKGGDGFLPNGGLTSLGGVLYGATTYGGSGSCFLYTAGCGTIFKLNISGKERVLYSFRHLSDGVNPVAPLTVAKGSLYGVTFGGGKHQNGIVFKVTTAGAETLIHRFTGGTDGANPAATLVDLRGTLYGTTFGGGAKGYGTVFAVSP
jgi:uncharacterized repeat protein (TIGR03803 family)